MLPAFQALAGCSRSPAGPPPLSRENGNWCYVFSLNEPSRSRGEGPFITVTLLSGGRSARGSAQSASRSRAADPTRRLGSGVGDNAGAGGGCISRRGWNRSDTVPTAGRILEPTAAAQSAIGSRPNRLFVPEGGRESSGHLDELFSAEPGALRCSRIWSAWWGSRSFRMLRASFQASLASRGRPMSFRTVPRSPRVTA